MEAWVFWEVDKEAGRSAV